MKKFITQQESLVPESRRKVPRTNVKKTPKRRGRKKSYMTLRRYARIWAIKQYLMRCEKITREGLAEALGLDKRSVNTLSCAFIRTTPEEDEQNLQLRQRYNRKFGKDPLLISVPVFTSEEIIRKDFDLGKKLAGRESVTVKKEADFGDRMHYFAMVMPDNCMVNDGICKGDRIVAVSNVRPSHGDMVVCRIPESRMITVRRFAACSNPCIFDLYEGGTINPLFCCESEHLLYGVVTSVVRSCRPGRLPDPEVPPEPVRKRTVRKKEPVDPASANKETVS